MSVFHRQASNSALRRLVTVLLAPLSIVAIITITSQQPASASSGNQTSSGAVSCAFSGTVTFSSPLKRSGGKTRASRILGTLSGCTTNSGIVESIPSGSFRGKLSSSPFTCSPSSTTTPTLTAVIDWDGKAWPSGGFSPTKVRAGRATGSFAGSAVVILQSPSDLAAACAGRGLRTTSVLGNVSVGPECGQIGDPTSVYPLVPPICGAQAYGPTSITTGSDGALWFLAYSDNVVGRMTTAGVTTFYPVPFKWNGNTDVPGPDGITSGPDGALWFVANSGTDIVRMTTGGTVTNIYPMPTGFGAGAITSGPDGALWLLCGDHTTATSGICELTTTGQITYFPDPSFPGESGSTGYRYFYTDITTGSDGALWFTELATSTSVGGFSEGWIDRMTTSGVFSEYQIPFTFQPETLTAGPDSAIWFAGPVACGRIDVSTNTWYCYRNGIGRVTTSGAFTDYIGQPGQIGNVVDSITAGPDGALWFTNYTIPGDSGYVPYQSIGRITTNGSITTYGNPDTEEGAMGITPGPDGAMWFADRLNDSIGRISVP